MSADPVNAKPASSPFYCFAVGIAPDEGAGHVATARLEELRERTRWLIRLRWLAACGLTAATTLGAYVFEMDVPAAKLYSLAAFLVVCNTVLYIVTRPPGRASDPSRDMPRANALAITQIAVDLVVLTALLHLSGGVENPFFLYFVFHMAIASVLLSRSASFHIASFANALFFGLAIAERFHLVRHYSLWGDSVALYEDPTYVFTVLVVFATTMYLEVYFAGNVVDRMRRRSAELVNMTSSLEKGTLQLQEAYEKMRAIEATKSDFLRTAAHQMKSPLSAIRSLLDVVIEGYDKDGAGRSDMLERARRRADLMIVMVNDLLTLSQLKDSGDAPAARDQHVDACDIMAELEALYRPRAEEKNLRLVIEPPPGYCVILAAPDDVRQALNNLLDNAITYTPAGGAVTCRSALEGGEVLITVSDTGIGIAEEDRERIFEEFYRAPNAKAAAGNGTGLGLAIVKRIVERRGGTIRVESELGKGTSFTLGFPVALTPRAD